MIAGLLKHSGVYLGADSDFLSAQKDNPAGFWEHFAFYALNERLLLHLGAGWDMPDLPDGWVSRSDLSPFRDVAWQLVERMRASAGDQVAWGWKDPRNSITIQFWKTLLPRLRVVVCVRNPLAVGCSLLRRNDMSPAASGRLWLRYYENLLRNVSIQDRVVSLYESYFADPDAELKRVLGALGLPADDEAMPARRGAVDPALNHHHASFEQLLASDCHPAIIEMYARLCAEARVTGQMRLEGPALAETEASMAGGSERPDLQRSRFHAETAQREEHIRHLTQENATSRQLLEDTRVQLRTLALEMSTLAGEMRRPAPRSDARDSVVRRLMDKIAAGAYGREALARRLSAIAGKALETHELIADTPAEVSGLQGNVERTPEDVAPVAGPLFAYSNMAEFVCSLLKRVRRSGRTFNL